MPAVPVPFTDEEDVAEGPDPFAVPFSPEPAAPTPAPAPELTEEERRRAIKGSRLRLEAATEEVERLKPSVGKLLAATGLNVREGAVGATKQTVGNLVRSWTDIMAPTKPHAPGSFQSFLQAALRPFDPTMGVLGISSLVKGADLESPANVLRQAGADLAAAGTEQLRLATEETEQLGGGPLVQGVGSLARTFGASAPALLAGPGGLGALGMAAGLQSYGSTIESFKAKLMERQPGLTEQEAYDKAMLPAAAAGAATAVLTRAFGGTERFIEQIMTRGFTQQGVKGMLRDTFKSASLEFPEEYLDQLSQGFLEKAFVDPDKQVKDIFDDAGIAGLSGFALGGVTTGGISAVAQTGLAAGRKAGEAIERSRVRRESDLASRRRIRQVIEEREAQDAIRERQTREAVRAVQEQPIEGEGEVPAAPGAPGVPQRAIPRAQVPITPGPVATQDVVQEAVNRVFPPALPKRTAVFGGYLYDNPNLPSYKIPGVRPGIMRDVSAATARQLGYSIPERIPTFEEWNAAGRPPTSTPEVSFSPAEQARQVRAQPGVPPDMHQLFPNQGVQDIAAQYATIPTEVLAAYPGGLTKFWHDLGGMARTPEDVAALRRMAEEVHPAEFKRLIASGDMDTAMMYSARQPAEAYEFATGVMLSGKKKWDTFEKVRPGYVPAVPDRTYLEEKIRPLASPAGKVIAGRSPEIQQGIQDLLAGKITRAQYDAIVQQYRPIGPVTSVPVPSTYEEMLDPVNGVKAPSRPVVGKGATIPAGTSVALRADLPWKQKTGKTAVVVHAANKGAQPGTVLAFEGNGRITNPKFLGSQAEAAKIGKGTGRTPFAAIFGGWSADQSIPADVMQWTQVGFDPTRHSYYYDKSSLRPVVGGSEAIQIGNTVFVKDAVFGPMEATLYSPVQTIAEAQAQTAQPVNWRDITYVNDQGERVLNEERFLQQVKDGTIRGSPGAGALLQHLMQRSDLHPLEPVKVITDLTPDQVAELARSGFARSTRANKAAAASPYAGLFIPKPGTATAEIEIIARDNDSNPITQQEFMRLLAHEFVHNNITSKIQFASPELQQRAQDVYLFVLQRAEGTVWQNHNALANADELFAEASTVPELQQWLLGLEYTQQGKKPKGLLGTVWGQILDVVRQLLGLPETLTTPTGQEIDVLTALDEIMQLSAELEQVRRVGYAEEPGVSPAPAAPPAPVTLSQAQIAAGTAEVGRIADAIYKEREAAGADLEGLSYTRRQFRMARGELNRLSDLAAAGYRQQELSPEDYEFPDPKDGVTIDEDGQIQVDPTFVTALTVGGVAHNPANVMDMQREVFYETSAHRYNNLSQQIETLQDAEVYYTQLGVDAEEIAKITKQVEKLETARSNLGDAMLGERTVADRAGEIVAAESMRQERLAKRDALSLEPVVEFFGRQIGGYRDVLEKAKAGLAFANAAVSNTDPEAAKAALAEAQRWMNIPTDVRNAILTGKPLSAEQRTSIFASLGQTFEEFDFSAARMRDMAEARIPELNKLIRGTLLKVANAKTQKGMAEVLVADVLATLDGETGATGNLKSLADTQALRDRISAIESFAKFIGENMQTNEALFHWLANPTTPKPLIPPGVTMGTDPQTLGMILNEVKRNPPFASSVLTLIQAANEKLAAMPLTGLKQIEDLLKNGSQESQKMAESVAQGMLRKARGRSSLAATSLRDNLKTLDAMEIERRALQEGLAMFQQLAAAPDFGRIRDAVGNSKYGLVEPMVEQNHFATTFKAFGFPGLPSHAGLVLDASQDPQFKSEWFKKVAEWNRLASEYVTAYDTALADHLKDPQNNPNPQSLGFDIPKVRGLRDATERFVPGSFLDLSVNSESKRWRVPGLARSLNRLAMFRQHDFVAKMVGGQTGFDLRARLADFINHYLIAQGIRENYRDIPDKLHQALRSHPELKMNIAAYRLHFNELAHMGRIFGSPLKAGFVLPRSGRTVTPEDMAFLKRELAYEETLRRRVTETVPIQGVRVKTQTRTLVRPGAFVGEEGLPRFPSRRADPFIADVLASYAGPVLPGSPPGTVPPLRSFDATTDLGPSSSNPVVQFWNRNLPLLVQHILDINRQDRLMTITPPMQEAERELHNNWIINGVQPVDSLDALVNLLVPFYPPQAVTGYNPREAVIRGLQAELRQYRDAANRVAQERAERDQARQSRPDIAFSADNEFTRPAAKLELPSPLYDYGAVSPGEHLTIASRANHERIVAYATALNRAIAEIQDRLTRYNDGTIDEKQAALSYGGDVREMRDVLAILQKIQQDFKNAYATGSFSAAPRGVINDTLGLLTSAILALPTVGLRNMTQGQMEVYAMSRAMGNAGHFMTAWRALKAMPRTLTRFALHLVDGLVKRSNVYAGLVTGQNRHVFEDMVGMIGNALTGEDFRAVAEKVRELGMDNREAFLQRLKRIWQESAEFVDREQLDHAWTIWDKTPLIGGRRAKGVAAMAPKFFRALFDKLGVQQYDLAINTAALNNAEILARRLKEVAFEYGKARENLGPFDPENRAWDLKPTEWSSATRDLAEDSLNNFRLLLESSVSPLGFQLERAMWNWYQRHKAGDTNAPMFTPEQLDALQRKLLADFNASTPANRPASASANNVIRNLLLLQGYPSDLLLKLVNTGFGKTRDRAGWVNATMKAPVMAALALMAVLIGYFTSAVTGSWEKYVRGRMPSLATPLDADFWTSWKRWAEGTLALGAAQFGYIGDIILGLMGEIRGNRGFDPTGRILAVSLVSRAINAVRGAINTSVKGAGDKSDALVPMLDVSRSMVPFWLETERVLGLSQGSMKQAERVRRGEAMTQGLIEGRSGFIPPTYGPTTVVRRNVGQHISKWYDLQQAGDTAGAAAELEKARAEVQKLEDYHYTKFLAAGKDAGSARTLAQRAAWADYSDLNPAVAALLGKRPTAGQEELMLKGITGDRRAAVDRGDAAWKAGALALFNRQGATTREDVAAARAGIGGGGRGFPLPGAAVRFRFPGLPGASLRRTRPLAAAISPPARALRSRIRRTLEAPLAAVRRGTRAVRRGLPRALRARPERRLRGPSIRAPRTASARRRLGTRRRRDYSVA